jgi:phosphatidylserine decarboxylase
MKLHKEGHTIILIAFLLLAAINAPLIYFLCGNLIFIPIIIGAASLVFFYLILHFFRVPTRNAVVNDNQVIAPADGKVVVIEEVEETEYFKDKRIQVSIFMSPLNVHIQWYPINGIVDYVKYHPGKYLVAWHPKSSTENERTTIVVTDQKNRSVLFRQIAGAVARRIVYFAKEKDTASQGKEFGFIKFGSRVDVLLPLDAKIAVELEQKVVGSETILANFSDSE